MTLHSVLFPTVLLLALIVRSDQGLTFGGADQRPRCTRCDRHFSCSCSHSSFPRVPSVAANARSLDLSCNNITMVTADDLTDFKLLIALNLRANGLASIQELAFDSLWNLEDLDLSDNRLMVVNQRWFRRLGVLRRLNLLNNPYSCLGSPVFQDLIQLRTLAFGGPALEELTRQDLREVTQLNELAVHANNLRRYESGALANIWPLGHVILKLHGPFLANSTMVSAMLADVSYPDTHITLEDLQLTGKGLLEPFSEAANRRVRQATLRNVSITDEAFVDMMMVTSGMPLTYFSFQDVTLTGNGEWEKADKAEHQNIDEFFARNIVVVNFFMFVSLSNMTFLMKYPRKLSVINSSVFVIPCPTSQLLTSLHYLDLSNNLLTDLTLTESLCDGGPTLQDLRVLNVSGNALKSLSTISRLSASHSKLTHLDISRNSYNSMPPHCHWPPYLRYLNISGAKLTAITPCLPPSLQVLDLSHNDLRTFNLTLGVLIELHLSGNKLLHLPAGHLFPHLEILNLQFNALSTFAASELRSYQRLKNLRAAHNRFVCSCDFVAFLQADLEGGGTVELTDNEDFYICDSPLSLQGTLVAGARLSVAECHWVLVVSVGCGLALILGTLVFVLLWHLNGFWYLKMMWAWLRAKRGSRRRRNLRGVPGSEALLAYDAFVSYSERDACWVENLLVPELEGYGDDNQENLHDAPRPLTLCLHKRDFLPGRWIMDNIVSAMESSRRTVFVLSESFVRSDWCRYELDFSHFWFLDGDDSGGDTAILILLEPLSKDDVPKRFCKLRKLMRSTTYLEWPQDEDRRAQFWTSLRDALRCDENQ